MDVTDRNQYERSTLADTSGGIRRGSERGSMIYVLIAVPLLLLLCYGTVKIIEGWWQWLVLAVLFVMTYALMRAVGPRRMGAGQGSSPDQLSS